MNDVSAGAELYVAPVQAGQIGDPQTGLGGLLQCMGAMFVRLQEWFMTWNLFDDDDQEDWALIRAALEWDPSQSAAIVLRAWELIDVDVRIIP